MVFSPIPSQTTTLDAILDDCLDIASPAVSTLPTVAVQNAVELDSDKKDETVLL